MSMIFAMAWRNVFRNGRRSMLTATAMAVSVAVVMGMGAFNHGMFDNMRDMMISQNLGHVQIQHPDYPATRKLRDTVHDADSLLTKLSAEPSVLHASPRLYGGALLGTEEATEGVQLIGVDPQREEAIRGLRGKLTAGDWLGDAAQGDVVLGDELAKKLQVTLGAELVAVTQASDGSLGNEIYTVRGIVHTGSVSIDRAGAFLHRRDLGVLLALDDQVHEVIVVARDHSEDALVAVTAAATAAVGEREASIRTWREVDPATAQMMGMQGYMQWINMVFFYGVSAVGVVNTLLMSVMERTREFGVMRAVGLRPRSVVTMVVSEAVVLGFFAVLGGALLGACFDAYLVMYGFDLSLSEGQGLEVGNATLDPVIYGHVTFANVVQPIVGVFLFCTLAAVWPAIRAARMPTIDALREA